MELDDTRIDQLYRRAIEFGLTSPADDDDTDVELRLNELLRTVGAATESAPASTNDFRSTSRP